MLNVATSGWSCILLYTEEGTQLVLDGKDGC